MLQVLNRWHSAEKPIRRKERKESPDGEPIRGELTYDMRQNLLYSNLKQTDKPAGCSTSDVQKASH